MYMYDIYHQAFYVNASESRMITLLDRILDLTTKAMHISSCWRELRGLLKQL